MDVDGPSEPLYTLCCHDGGVTCLAMADARQFLPAAAAAAEEAQGDWDFMRGGGGLGFIYELAK